MRLFIALGISREAIDELKKAQAKLVYSKLTLVKEFHLTLKFLGEVEENAVEGIKEKLSKVKFEGFDACTNGLGVFPSIESIRVIWAGLEPKDKIEVLQNKIEDSLKGVFAKDDKFHAHITIARVKFIENKKQFKDSLNNIKLKKIKFRVDSFKLIKSTLLPVGPVYEVLEEYKARH
ncbi:MAG: RNA 2',3'-cyclic phosphodiesterase [Candidatus Woesearchaeota archaeon]|nr:RNA 2',3'-cyclic phosphodiesterase [Candidatus Woesearchaeota archaeon]